MKIMYLSHHEVAVTGGHKYNEAFEKYLAKISGVDIVSTPSCAKKYKGWRKIYSPFAELKHLKNFGDYSLVMFGDTTFKHHFLLAMFNKWFVRSQTTMIIHHFLFIGQHGIGAKIQKWLMCKYTSMMDSIIVPSPYTMDVAKGLFPKKKIYYIPLPFEKKFKKSSEYEIGNFLYVGTVEERKGLSYLIEALSQLDNKKKIRLNIVGKIANEKYYDELKKLIKGLGLNENVCFHGRISDEKLKECYQKAEIFTFPSLLEGYGIVLVEAFNNGLPVICFDNTAMPYTVKDGVNGLIAKNKDSKDFAAKIELLSGNKELRERLLLGVESSVNQLKTRADFEQGINAFYDEIFENHNIIL